MKELTDMCELLWICLPYAAMHVCACFTTYYVPLIPKHRYDLWRPTETIPQNYIQWQILGNNQFTTIFNIAKRAIMLMASSNCRIFQVTDFPPSSPPCWCLWHLPLLHLNIYNLMQWRRQDIQYTDKVGKYDKQCLEE